MRDRVRELLAQCVSSIVAGLAVAGQGQWGFPWFPVEEDPGPGELSWAEFDAEVRALLDAAERGGVGDGSRPSSEPRS